jgi:nucleoside-diphosphate-sugar epimerase
MTILIIGCGLVGSQIARLELERGESPVMIDANPRLEALNTIIESSSQHAIKLLSGDVLNPADLARVVKEEKIDRIIHTAANPLLTSGAQKNPYDAIRLNIMGTTNVLEVAKNFGVKRVVLTSSSVLYYYQTGGSDNGKIGYEDAFPRPSTIYASTKLACENLGMNYSNLFGFEFVAVRFTAVFGPWPIMGGGSGTQAFREAIDTLLAGKQATLSVHGSEFVYSKDAARGTVLALNTTGLKDRVFNISMGRIYSQEDIANILSKLIPGSKISLESDRTAGRVSMDATVNMVRARNQLGYSPQYDMEAALRDYVDWSKKHGRLP